MVLFRKKTTWNFLNLLLKIFILINAFVLAETKDTDEDKSIKVSIIIPTYNAAPFLERCINSALNQTLQEIEVIVVNDKSTDNTEEILKKYEGEKKFKAVTLDKNQGQSVARNTGIEMARGEFIGFIDSDDLVDLDFFENLYKLSKDKDIVIGIFVNSTNDTNKFSHHRKLYKYGCVGDSIWRKSFLDEKKILFEKGVGMAEDVHFRAKVYGSKPRRTEAPDVGSYYYYKRREGSVMNYDENFIQKIFDESKEDHIEKSNSSDSLNKTKEENDRIIEAKEENDKMNKAKKENNKMNETKEESNKMNEVKEENVNINDVKEENLKINKIKEKNIKNINEIDSLNKIKNEDIKNLNGHDSLNKPNEENDKNLNGFYSLMSFIKNHIIAIAFAIVSFILFVATVIFFVRHHYNKQIKKYVSLKENCIDRNENAGLIYKSVIIV